MNCREFQEKHCSFIDDTLPGIDIVRVQGHLAECPSCAEHDTRIRKSLLLFRNLPCIEPSCDFTDRLRRKLNAQPHYLVGPHSRFSANQLRVGTMTVAGIALAGVAMLAYTSLQKPQASRDIVFPPVVASVPDVELTPIEEPGFEMFASASAGIPIWPTAMLAEQTPRHIVNSIAISTGPVIRVGSFGPTDSPASVNPLSLRELGSANPVTTVNYKLSPE